MSSWISRLILPSESVTLGDQQQSCDLPLAEGLPGVVPVDLQRDIDAMCGHSTKGVENVGGDGASIHAKMVC